jgi:hypothetical protein
LFFIAWFIRLARCAALHGRPAPGLRMSWAFAFEVLTDDPSSRARLGRLAGPHGTIETPAFVSCAIRAAIGEGRFG